MKYINEKAPSVKSKVKDINKKIGKLVSKKEDAISKAKEMADSEEPSGKMQASLAKIQLRQSESEAEKEGHGDRRNHGGPDCRKKRRGAL